MLKLSTSGKLLLETIKTKHPFYASRCFCSVSTDAETNLSYDKNPGPVFLRKDVQKLLGSITRLELDKIFRKRSVKDNTVEYKFMTDDQLREEVKKSIGLAGRMLQMPPIVHEMQDNPRVLAKEGALKGFSDVKIVFTDITHGLKNSKRTIVERLTDGTLQEASFETRKRLNQIYFPLKGRHIRMPSMFEASELNKILAAGDHEFILDRACIQFEPYEKDYHRVTATVYQHVNENKLFDSLRSTRHFGPMSFFLTWHRSVDDLLLDMIKREYFRNGVELIVLYCTLHDVKVNLDSFEQIKQHILGTESPAFELEDRTTEQLQQDEKYLSLIEQFVIEHCLKKVQLNLAIATGREMLHERMQLAEGIRNMHGRQ
ncbi:small ribosomal subunit protein mS22 [Malaya genurostris]|uniref:small ribosomal subunit protein mS22 n=1 Tax=Malaya genurostris TaxID=325434 RepID=UPI0026F3EC83|nr:small ribosomal subunit protein mS22 [Malaya genurostris]